MTRHAFRYASFRMLSPPRYDSASLHAAISHAFRRFHFADFLSPPAAAYGFHWLARVFFGFAALISPRFLSRFADFARFRRPMILSQPAIRVCRRHFAFASRRFRRCRCSMLATPLRHFVFTLSLPPIIAAFDHFQEMPFSCFIFLLMLLLRISRSFFRRLSVTLFISA